MKGYALPPLLCAMALLILDSRCAAQSVQDALMLCMQSLIPGLFPMLVISSMTVPHLSGIRIPGLSRLMGLPEGSEGFVLLGCAGGFPVGAACIVQAVRDGGLRREDAGRMLGVSSFCGPSFLFGIIGGAFSMREAGVLFLIQLQTALLAAMLWSKASPNAARTVRMSPVSARSAVGQAVNALSSICAWVMLAAVAAGFLRRWLGPMLPQPGAVLLTGLLELTGGVFAAAELTPPVGFILCAVFVCFGGVSVLLQIGSLAAEEGLPMSACVAQKAVQGLLGGVLAAGYLSFGPLFLLTGFLPPAGKIAVEISGRMVYNGRRKEGI